MPTKAKGGPAGPKKDAAGQKPNALQTPLQPSKEGQKAQARKSAR